MRLPLRALALAGLALTAAPRAFADEPPSPPAPSSPRADGPAPGAAPAAPRGKGSWTAPDPVPWLSISGAGLAGISRDGSVVLFRMQHDEVGTLFRTGPDGGWPFRVTFRRDSPDSVSLSPDGSKAVVGWDKDGDEDYGLHLVSVADPAAESPLRVLPKVRCEDVRWSDDGARIFFRDNADGVRDFHLKELTIATGAVRTVLAREGSWSVEDAAPDGARLLVRWSRSNYDASLYVLDLHPDDHGGASGALTEIDPSPKDRLQAPGGAKFLGAGAEVVFASDRGGEWFLPYVATLSTGAVRPLLAGGDRETRDADEGAASPDGTRVWVVWNDGGRGRISGAEVATGAAIPGPDLGEGIASAVRVDAKGRLFFTLSRADGPGSVVRWDPAEGRVVPLTFPDTAGVAKETMRLSPRLVEYASFDGKKVPAWLYLPQAREGPAGKAPRNLPFVVSFHGGPEGQERPGFNAERAYLVSQGYGVLAPNVRGSTGMGKTWRDLDNYKGRLDSVKDGKAAADWLVAQGLADAKRIACMGGSYGGYMVLAELTEFPDTFAAGIEIVGISDFETFLDRTAPYRRALREAEYGPLTDREFLRSVSPIHKVDRITAPLLILHGEKDPRVPVGEARQIEQALKDLSRPVEALYFSDEGHGFSKRPNRVRYLKAVAKFLHERIGAGRE